MLDRLKGSKTFWAAVVVVVTAVGAYLTGEIELSALLTAVSTAVIGIFLRDGIAKTGG